jgi:hypothetical protein
VHIISKQNKRDYSNLCNFRPKSVVNIFAKVFEKVILGRLKWHAHQYNWFHENQHGFIPGRSTETAAHQLTNPTADKLHRVWFYETLSPGSSLLGH